MLRDVFLMQRIFLTLLLFLLQLSIARITLLTQSIASTHFLTFMELISLSFGHSFIFISFSIRDILKYLIDSMLHFSEGRVLQLTSLSQKLLFHFHHFT